MLFFPPKNKQTKPQTQLPPIFWATSNTSRRLVQMLLVLEHTGQSYTLYDQQDQLFPHVGSPFSHITVGQQFDPYAEAKGYAERLQSTSLGSFWEAGHTREVSWLGLSGGLAP